MTIENASEMVNRHLNNSSNAENCNHLSPEIVVLEESSELKKGFQHLFPEINIVNDGQIPERCARSAPSSRSCSFKEKQKENELDVPRERHRRNSMPQTSENFLSVSFGQSIKEKQPLQRVRSFKTTSKGIVYRGDSFRLKNEDNIASSGRVQIENDLEFNNKIRQRIQSDSSDVTTCSSLSSNFCGYYKIAVLGAQGVGKTALINHFMSSEYMETFDIPSGVSDEDDMKVSVLLNEEESMMEFLEIEDTQCDLESLQVDAYLIMYSLNDRVSYCTAVNYIHKLRNEIDSDRVTILVGNKVDLVRKRFVSEKEAKLIAEQYNCKCTEISAGLNHKVDELLVGILRQIRLNLNPAVREPEKDAKEKESSSKGPKRLLSKLFKKSMSKVQACENLYEP